MSAVFAGSVTANNSASEISPKYFVNTKVYPNPIGKTFNVEFSKRYNGYFNLQMIDPVGKMYELGKFKLKPEIGNTKIDISKLSLKPGIYFLRISSDTGQAETIKLTLQ